MPRRLVLILILGGLSASAWAATACDATDYRAAAVWTGGGGADRFREPMGVAVSPDGRVYVADSRNRRVVELTADGRLARQLGAGGGSSRFEKPVDVVVGRDGVVYVADFDSDQVSAFSPQGAYLRVWGGPGDAAGRFHGPAGLAVDAAGDVYVSDFYNDRVQVFDSNGTYLRTIGRKGHRMGDLNYPTGLAFDRSGDLLVADAYNHRLQRFTPQGAALGTIGSNWRSFWGGAGALRVPSGVAVDARGRIYVADSAHGRVAILGRDGSYLGDWRLPGGAHPGVYSPERVAVAPGGDVLAVDTAGDRVFVLRPGKGASPPTAPAAPVAPEPVAGDIVVRIAGMSCPFCAYGVEKHLKALPGVRSARVNLGEGTAVLELLPDRRVALEEIRRAVQEAGFKASEVTGFSGHEGMSP